MMSVLRSSRTGAKQKVLAVGIGWSFAQTLTGTLVQFWGAKNYQFSWKYISMAAESNAFLLCNILQLSILVSLSRMNR